MDVFTVYSCIIMHLDFATRTIFDLIISCNFSYLFAFGIMAFGVASSGLLPAGASVKSLNPANMCVSLRSAKLSARSVPSLQELHGPEHAETRARRRNLERFQRQHGPID